MCVYVYLIEYKGRQIFGSKMLHNFENKLQDFYLLANI